MADKRCRVTPECEERQKFSCKEKCLRRLLAYDVDTCHLSYKPRLLYVDPCSKSCEENVFKTLDEALCHTYKYHGGYVIKLSPGTHKLRTNLLERVDNLTIIGDTNPLAGVPFINGQRLEKELINVVPHYDIRIGKGPYRVTVNAHKIKVYGECNPDFSCLCEGYRVGFVFSSREEGAGEIRNFKIKCARGNTITLDENFGLSRPLFVGEGFFIYPNTAIETSCPQKIFVTNILEFAGIYFNVANPFAVGAGIYTRYRNCVIDGTIYQEYVVNTSIPNVIIGTFIFSGSATGVMAFQGILGKRGRIVSDGSVGGDILACTFSLCELGAGIFNGGKSHFHSCDFFLNEGALRVTSGSVVHIPGCFFIDNIVAVNAFYNSTISSKAGARYGLTHLGDAPRFINNRLTFGAEWGTFYNVANLILEKPEEYTYLRIDGRIRQNPNENPDDSLGNAGSFVADKPNQYAGTG